MTPNSPENRLLALLRHMGTLPLMRLPETVELSPPAVGLIGWVDRSPGCGVLDIAKGLHLAPPTISVGIRKLEKSGWLERRHDPNDRRARPLYLTPKGEELMQRVRAHRTQMLKFFLDGLPPTEQEQLLDLLERAISIMAENLASKHES
jgi:DNA-binding MarR family transcriptional regulator